MSMSGQTADSADRELKINNAITAWWLCPRQSGYLVQHGPVLTLISQEVLSQELQNFTAVADRKRA